MSDQDTSLSLDDLLLVDVVDDVNPDAELTDAPPPPPAGRYAATPTLLPFSDKGNVVKPFTVDGQNEPHLMINVDWKFEYVDARGVKSAWTKRSWHNTMANKVGLSEIDALFKAYYKKAPVGMGRGAKVKAVVEQMAANVQVLIDVDWEATVKTGEKNKKGKDEYVTVRRGMKNFLDANGVPQPLKESPEHPGLEVRNDVAIKNFLAAA